MGNIFLQLFQAPRNEQAQKPALMPLLLCGEIIIGALAAGQLECALPHHCGLSGRIRLPNGPESKHKVLGTCVFLFSSTRDISLAGAAQAGVMCRFKHLRLNEDTKKRA